MRPTAFTSKFSNGIANQIITLIDIVVPNTNISHHVGAIWDTGATASVITTNIVNKLNLVPTGMTNVITANGPALQNTYIVEIVLPNGLVVKDVTVTEIPGLSSGCEVLIGMDIIVLGDFSITNYKGTTCMSFRIPSMHEIDYVKNLGVKVTPKIQAGQSGSNRSLPKKRRK